MTHPQPARPHARSGRGPALAAVSLASLFLVGACSAGPAQEPGIASLASQSPGDGQVAAPTARATLSPDDREEALLAFAACMRDNGVDMPDPQFGLDGKANMGTLFADLDEQDETVQAATAACDALLPSSLADDPVLQAERQDALLVFAQCMRDNGVQMDDPVAGGGPGRGPMATLDQNDPTVAAGLEVCRPLLGTTGGGK